MILALDLATSTGWCIAKNDGTIVESGVKSFKKSRGESNGTLFLKARKWIRDMVQNYVLDSGDEHNLVVYEQAHFRGGAATELCVGLQTRVQEVTAELEVECAPVRTNTLKQFATGVGNAGKEQMIQAATILLGRDPYTDDEADAVLLAQVGACTYLDGCREDYKRRVPETLFPKGTKTKAKGKPRKTK